VVLPLKTAAAVRTKPAFLGGLPVVDAGAIAELIANQIQLGALNGTTAAQLVTINDIWNDAIAQGLPVGGWTWGRIGADLPTLGGVAQQGSALAWSLPGLEGLYGARFPGWTVTGKSWFDQFKIWLNTALNTAQGVAGVASRRYGQMIMDLPDFGSLQGFVSAANGRDAALQAGNQVNLWSAEQIEQLNATVAANAAAEQAYYGYRLQMDAAKMANLQTFFNYVPAVGGKSYDCCN
jgi:P-type conjugative transfer protein TrbJ